MKALAPLKHFLFTNFGVGITDELWLNYRLDIFINTAIPSIIAQSNQNFEWHIFIDGRILGCHRVKLENVKRRLDNLHIHEVFDYSRISREITRITSASDCKTLLTSRLDDDDCLHVEAIDFIQKSAKISLISSEVAIIALKNGIEYLPTDKIARPTAYESLALGLTLADRSTDSTKRCINHYAHHMIIETLKKQGVKADYVGIERDFPLYIYTKHQLSDSYYFGARARILGSENTFQPTQELLDQFGLSPENANNLQTILRDAPVGMPHKYLEQLANIRRDITTANSHADSTKDLSPSATEALSFLLARQKRLENQATRQNPSRNNGAKIRVAILGSCVTRDLFEIQKASLSRFEVCFYNARSSMVACLSTPNTDPRLRIPNDGFESKRAIFDLQKSIWDHLEASRPDIVVVDLIDERIGLIQHRGAIFSASGPMIKAFERANLEVDIVRPWNEVATKLRKWAAPHFLERIQKICSTIFLHKAKWAETYLDIDGTKKSFERSQFSRLIELNNSILDAAFLDLEDSMVAYENIGGIEVKSFNAGGKHLWAFCPYHFDEAYYKALSKQLLARVC